MVTRNRTKVILISLGVLLFVYLFLSMVFRSFIFWVPERWYYTNKSVYIQAEGTVKDIQYFPPDASLDLSGRLYLEIDECPGEFIWYDFYLWGTNADIVMSSEKYSDLQIGSHIEFMSAPYFFGDGYVYPIAALWIDGTEVLSFDEGLKNIKLEKQ